MDEPVRCKPISVDLELLIGSTQEMVEAMGRLKKCCFGDSAACDSGLGLLEGLMDFQVARMQEVRFSRRLATTV
jgi:hypothetical protein